jgi:hypothetical protein
LDGDWDSDEYGDHDLHVHPDVHRHRNAFVDLDFEFDADRHFFDDEDFNACFYAHPDGYQYVDMDASIHCDAILHGYFDFE